MDIQIIPEIISKELNVKAYQVAETMKLLDEGNTVPFIARYRKERTNQLDEEQIRTIQERTEYLRHLAKRQDDILATIESQGKLTPELSKAIQAITKLQDLEDLYLPYKPKKRTRAQIARERSLEPLANKILAQDVLSGEPLTYALPYVNPENGTDSPELAIQGAIDIIAEMIAEDANIRAYLRKRLWYDASIATKLDPQENESGDFLNYKEYKEAVKHIPSHRILAINRGEKKNCLKVEISAPHEVYIEYIVHKYIMKPSIFSPYLKEAAADSYKRLLFPSMERELRSLLSDNAEKQAIQVFSRNLRQLLLQPPFAGYTVMGLDPGFRTGCKMAVINFTGAVLTTDVIYITHSDNQKLQATQKILDCIKQYNVTLISIGNGTASYETEEFVAELIKSHNLNLNYLITSEAGASVYSASKLAKDELPDLDVSLRGAVSIARRIQDPLAELVKIDPKSIGVGQYQHDVNQKELGLTLSNVVESCVNHVGVELNTASPALLTYVSGISSSIAKNIVTYRNEQGVLKNRKSLLNVPRLGKAAFTQCAGFLRLQDSTNPLDNTPIHPESYTLAENILAEIGFTLSDLKDKATLATIQQKTSTLDIPALADKFESGQPTIKDIIDAFAKPGRDPREDLPKPLTRKNIVKLSDIQPGTITKGTVQNITDFGVFVDIGIKTNGLVHRSELSNRPFRHPLDVVSVGDIVDCLVLSIDETRNRIALSLKQFPLQTTTN